MTQQTGTPTSSNELSDQAHSMTTSKPSGKPSDALVPDWLAVILVLCFIHFILPSLTATLFKIFLLTH